METVGKVRNLLADFPTMASIKVDVIGVGAGVADRLREERYPIVDVNVGSGSTDPEKWLNLRCELWWNLRERFREGDVIGPLDDTTLGQLSSIRYRYDSRHTHPVIESKEDAKKRGVHSPDRAEAVMLAFAQRSDLLPYSWKRNDPAVRAALLAPPDETDEARTLKRIAAYLAQHG
jgi:hypothetical protein